jgi:hypothetical protein
VWDVFSELRTAKRRVILWLNKADKICLYARITLFYFSKAVVNFYAKGAPRLSIIIIIVIVVIV